MLIIVDAMIACLALTGVGLVIALPVWVVMAPIVMVLSHGATKEYNRQNGLVMR